MSRPRRKELALAFALAAVAGAALYLGQHGLPSGAAKPPTSATRDPSAPPPPPAPGRFVDRTAAFGIDFVHVNGASGERYFPETMGAGAVFFDYDGDGYPDLFIVQSGPLPGYAGQESPDGRLYRNDAGRRFVDVTEASGLAGHGAGGYGMGAYAADIDNDGHLDLLVTRLGEDRLYRNKGDGTFEDVTRAAGVGTPGWSTSACFVDLDRDGFVDLYVARYTDYRADHANHKPCVTAGHRSYCTPLDYRPLRDVLYRNRGDGTFEDVTERWGVLDDPTGYGLGVLAFDADGDGWPDLYVANDLGDNRLYRNRGDGRLVEVGLEAGVALSEDGRQQAGMGVAAGDADGDGRLDLVCTNYQGEVNNLYLNRSAAGAGALAFVEEATASRLGALSLRRLGFGVAWLDVEPDGRLDLLVANGHVMDNVHRWDETARFAQPLLLAHNVGSVRGVPRFEAAPAEGPFALERVWRGIAVADIDRDGDLDVLVTANAGPPLLLVAEGPPAGAWIGLRLEGTRSNRAAIGARVEVEVPGGASLVQEVHAGSSYLSQNDLGLVFGLGALPAEARATVTVRWPAGLEERHADVEPGFTYRSREGDAALRRFP